MDPGWWTQASGPGLVESAADSEFSPLAAPANSIDVTPIPRPIEIRIVDLMRLWFSNSNGNK